MIVFHLGGWMVCTVSLVWAILAWPRQARALDTVARAKCLLPFTGAWAAGLSPDLVPKVERFRRRAAMAAVVVGTFALVQLTLNALAGRQE